MNQVFLIKDNIETKSKNLNMLLKFNWFVFCFIVYFGKNYVGQYINLKELIVLSVTDVILAYKLIIYIVHGWKWHFYWLQVRRFSVSSSNKILYYSDKEFYNLLVTTDQYRNNINHFKCKKYVLK